MKYALIILLISTIASCQKDQLSNQNMQLAEEYGVVEMIDFAPDFESVDREEWIEFLETAVEMKKTEEFYKREHEKQKVVIKAFNSELESAEDDQQRQEIWNRYGAKYDWIVTSENAVIE